MRRLVGRSSRSLPRAVSACLAACLATGLAEPSARAEPPRPGPGRQGASITQCAPEAPALSCPSPSTFRPSPSGPPPPPLVTTPLRPADPPKPLEPQVTVAETRLFRGRPASGAARGLLLGQIAQLEALLRDTPRSSNDRPRLLRATADAYAELEASASNERGEAESRGAAAEAEAARKTAEAARASAIRLYGSLIDEHPGAAKIDEALYALAYEREQAGQLDEARAAYFRLLRDHPSSPLVAYAYVAFGELFFADGKDDPGRLELARLCYERALAAARPDDPAWGYSQYKLGHVLWASGGASLPLAEAAFERAARFALDHARKPGAERLGEAARRDLLRVHALSGPAEGALSALARVSGDPPGQDRRALELYDRLGQAYLDVGRPYEARAVYEELGRRAGGSDCRVEAMLIEARAAILGTVPDLGDRLEALSGWHRRLVREGFSHDEVMRCGNSLAEAGARVAAAAHREARGGPPGAALAGALAERVYEILLTTFEPAELSAFAFPRLPREAWPTAPSLRYALGDLERARGAWAKCASAYGAAAEAAGAPEAAAAMEGEALCWLRLESVALSGAEPGSLGLAGEGMVRAFERYLCAARPAEGDARSLARRAEVAAARARALLSAGRVAEAAGGFLEVAANPDAGDESVGATLAYLDATSRLTRAGEAPAAACVDEMIGTVEGVIARRCEGDRLGPQAACERLDRARFASLALRADAIEREAERAGEAGLSKHEEAARSYLELARRCALSPIEARRPVRCDHPERLIERAGEAYRRGRFLMKSVRARLVLLDPRYHMEATDEATRAVYQIGLAYEGISVYDEAASWLEKSAQDYPRSGTAPSALARAVELRLSLGQEPEAIKGAELFARAYGGTRGEEASRVALAVAAHHARREEWALSATRLRATLAQVDRSSPLEARVQAHALLSLASGRLGQRAAAASELARASSLWASRGAQAGLPREPDAPAAKALEALAEALLDEAERAAHKPAPRFPAYAGPADDRAFDRYLEESVRPWVERRRAAALLAETAYEPLSTLLPSPPARFAVAAQAGAARAWARAVDEALSARLPRSIERDRKLAARLRARLIEALAPLFAPAREAAGRCVERSIALQHFGPPSRACEAWLARRVKGSPPTFDELTPAPRKAPAYLDRPPPAQVSAEPAVDP